MGAKVSKVAGPAATAARKYPTRPPPQHISSNTTASDAGSSSSAGVGPSVHPSTPASFHKSQAVRDDAADPDFAHMLKTVGAVQIPDSARSYDLGAVKNPQLRTLARRSELVNQQYNESVDPAARNKRSWVDVGTIREIVRMRDVRKWKPARIEKELGLAEGVVARLGMNVTDL